MSSGQQSPSPSLSSAAEKKDASHKANERMIRQSREQPAGFDERARDNSDKVKGIHEFRRGNIRDYEAPEKDFFDYDPEEKSRKYDALKLETIFRFSSTFKAIKWGIAVGSLFGGHRYYRTRSIESAVHWFSVMSFVSFANIWVSYGLQEFVTEFGSRKSVSLQQRNEYHQGAYKTYIQRLADETHAIDSKVTPHMTNETGQSLLKFSNDYIAMIQERFGTEDSDRGKIERAVTELEQIQEAAATETGSRLRRSSSSIARDMTPQEQALLNSWQRDTYRRTLESRIPLEVLEEKLRVLIERNEAIDLKSMSDWKSDPDCSYKVAI